MQVHFLSVFIDCSPNKKLNKKSSCRWFETPWSSCDVTVRSSCELCWMRMDMAPLATITWTHYSDVIMGAMASQITSLTIVYSTVYSSADQIKHQSSASLTFVGGIHRWPVNSLHKWPVTRKKIPFDDVIMYFCRFQYFHQRYWIEIKDRVPVD